MEEVNVALLGFGNVGRAFVRHILHSSDAAGMKFRVCAVGDVTGATFLGSTEELQGLLESGKTVGQYFPDRDLHDVPAYLHSLRSHGVTVLVECMPTDIGSGQPALTYLRAALAEKLHVVTVDKGPLVHGWSDLTQQARRAGVRLAYSGTTGVRPPSRLRNCRVVQIQGVLNGTTNYILSEMQGRAMDFHRALAKAREMGIAEPDPSLDIDGWDTSCKILILANAWMNAGASLADVYRTGIGQETESLIESARDMGHRVRLLGSARPYQQRVRVSVAPKIVDPDSPFYAVSGTSKAAVFTTEEEGDIVVPAQSGRDAIAQVIAGDVRYVAMGESA